MKDPAFLFYSSDFLTGTLLMTFEDRGKYITILSYMHQNGRLSEETIRLLVGSVSDMLRLKFSIDKKGFWFNERLEIEIEKRKNFVESRVKNGSKGGRPIKEKSLDIKPLGKPTDNLVENVNVNENINDNLNKNVSKKNEIVSALMLEFGFTETKNYDKLREIWNFINEVDENKGIDYFIETYQAYKNYKKLAGEIAHGFKGIMNGGWDADNWQHKIDNLNKPKQKESRMEQAQKLYESATSKI